MQHSRRKVAQNTVEKEFFLYRKKEMNRWDSTAEDLYRSDQESFLANTRKPTEKFEGAGENSCSFFTNWFFSPMSSVSTWLRATAFIFCFKFPINCRLRTDYRSMTLAKNCRVYSQTELKECRTFIFGLFFFFHSELQSVKKFGIKAKDNARSVTPR